MDERPLASVLRSMRGGRRRGGRGFSVNEIRGAGFTLNRARILGIPVDRRRRTSHPWNIELLKRRYTAIPLTEIKGIGEAISKRFEEAGVSSVQDLARCDIQKLSESVKLSANTLRKWQVEARNLIIKGPLHPPS